MKNNKIISLILLSTFLLVGCTGQNRDSNSESSIEEHVHSFGEWTSVDENTHEHICSCGEKETGDHTWDDGTLIKAATCDENGEEKYICTLCGKEKNRCYRCFGTPLRTTK